MQGYMCRISTLGGKSPPRKKGIKLRRKKWLCMARHETSSGYMAETQCQGIWHKAQIRQEKLMIMHSQLDIRGVWRETGQHNIKRSMRLLRNVMEVLYNGLPHPNGENVDMGTK